MRGVWILLEYMKWKKGTDGGGVGGRKKRERAEKALCCWRGGTKGASTFYPAIVCVWGGGGNANERALTLEGI